MSANENLVALWNGQGVFELMGQTRPEPGPNEVVLQVDASGICGSDLYFFGIKEDPDDKPAGHETAGTVIATGTKVTKLMEGDRVAVEMVGLSVACMKCWFCRYGQYIRCTEQSEKPGGGFSTFMSVSEQACFKLPSSLSPEEGALVEPLAVSLHGVRLSEIEPYETAVVLGAGTIGLMCVAALSTMGVSDIIVTAKHSHQGNMAKRLGATSILGVEDESVWLNANAESTGRGADRTLPDESPLWDCVSESTDGRGADAVFECVGGVSGGSLAQAISISRKLGRVVSIGAPKVPVPLATNVMLQRELRLLMSHCYSVIDGRHDFELAIDILASGALPIADVVTATFPLARINEAFDVARLKATGSGKVQIVANTVL